MNDVLARLQAALADRYTIERELGHGGMATVYLARDLKHDRDVALKVLRPELAAVLGAKRFLREIKITAHLQHPHILPLHDSGEADSFLFYVMPYVEGETLRDKLRREKQLDIAEAIDITRSVASALDYAHRQGVIHRDIKPANILLHEGQALVADFGIALAMSAEGEDRLTETGISFGTPHYMSPEQAMGDQELDARSDVYSLGAVLYEMLAGDPPYTGSTAQAIVAKMITEKPPLITVSRDTVPPHVSAALHKALAKLPADRFHRAAEFADALGRLGLTPAIPVPAPAPPATRGIDWRIATALGAATLLGLVGALLLTRGHGGPAAWRNSIAVLPFENFSGDSANEFFSEGITDDIIAHLSKLEGLKVISRTSVMRYRGQQKPLRQIGMELGVATILEGSVRRAAARVRVVAQLIDARTDEHLWAETYDRDLRDIFAIQSDIADRIETALGSTLGAGRTPEVAKRPTEDLEAYDLYLKGRYFWNRRRESTLRQAIDYFQRAIARDSSFALAYAGIADAYVVLPIYSTVPVAEAHPLARRAAERALALDPSLGEAHAALGYAHLFAWEWAESERELRRAIELNPGYATGHQWYGLLLGATGRLEEATAEMRQALELDPLSLIINANLGDLFFWRRRLEDALAQARRTLELDPDFPLAHDLLWWTYQQQHRYGEMETEIERWAPLKGVTLPAGPVLQKALATGGAAGLYRALLTSPPHQRIEAIVRAAWYLGVGDRDGAFRALEDGYAKRDPYMLFVNVDPRLDALHNDPRFAALLARMGLR